MRGVRAGVKLQGLEELLANLERKYKQARFAIVEALNAEASAIMEESLKQVPEDTGALAASAYMEPARKRDDSIRIAFGYGGKAVRVNPRTGQLTSDYDLIVHERLDLYHPKGKAKYLEDPVNAAIPGMEQRIGVYIRGALEVN